MNVCILLAPPVSMKNNSVALFKLMASPINRAIVTSMIETIHLYNILSYNYINSSIASAFCALFDGKLCDLIMSIFTDTDSTIDNTDRYNVYMSNLPAGACYRNIIHYA